MTRAPLPAALALTFAALPGMAQEDRPFRADLSQSVSVSSNPGLGDPANDPRLSARTLVDFTAQTRSARTRVALDGAVGFDAAVGGDVKDPVQPVAPRLRLSLDHAATPRLDLGAAARLRVERVEDQSFVLSADSGPADLSLQEESGLQIDGGLSLSAGYQIGALDRLSLGASADRTEFTGLENTDLEPSTDLGLSFGWTRQLDPVRSGSLTLSLNQRLSEAANADSQRANLRAGLSWQLAEDRSATLGLGVSAVDGDAFDDVEITVSGDLGAEFALTSRDRFVVSASQGVVPGQDGRVNTVTSANLRLSRNLTSRDQISAGLGATRQAELAGGDGSGDELFYRATLGYGRSIGRDVRLSADYTLRGNDSGADPDHTLAITLSIPLAR